MSLYAENKGGGFTLTPSGSHLGVCYRIIDLGTQKVEYMGTSKFQHKVMFAWELHITDDDGRAVRMDDDRPFSIFKNYTLSWSDKATLRQDLQSWRGKPFTQEELNRFDLKNVLGAWGMVNVIERQGQNGKTYANVSGITPVPSIIRQQGLPQRINKLELFTLSNPDIEMFSTFSDNLKAKIQASPEWQKRNATLPQSEVVVNDLGDDEIPF